MKLKLVSWLLCAGLATGATAADSDRGGAVRGVYRGVSTAVQFDVSPPLHSIAPLPIRPEKHPEIEDQPSGLEGAPGVEDFDSLVQSQVGVGEVPTPAVSFDGPNNIAGVSPPDPVGDVGPSHYVAMSNLYFAVYSKTGALLYGPAANNTLWSGFGGPCQTENAGDPVVLYDQLADRWILTQFTAAGPTYYNCVAVSQTGNPTGSYYRYAFSTGSNFPDYPKYGVWPDALYISTREFAGGAFAGVGAYAVNRAQLIAGNPTPQVISFLVAPGGTAYNIGDGLLPSDLDGSTQPPAGTPNFFMGSMDNGGTYGAPQDALTLWKFTANFTNPPASAFVLANTIPVAAFDSIFPCSGRACIPQPGTTNKVDILSYRQRPLHRLAYRNFGTHQSLVTNQSVEASTNIAGIRWYEIRNPSGTPVVYQQGTYAPGSTDGIHRWMGSLAMDRTGNMALGYSASDGTSTYPSVRYTGRLVGDALGTMPQGEGSFVAGTGAQTGSQRWGDYTSMNVDPVDDCTFWYVNEYVPTTSSVGWRLRVGSFKFPSCGTPDFTLTCTPTSLTLPRNQSRSTTCTVSSLGGFASAVSLSCSGLPSGVSCTPSPNPVTPPAGGSASSTVTFTANSSASLGSFTVQVSGTGGGLTRTANLSLTVNDPLVVSVTGTHWLATCNVSGGTAPYTYAWYVRYDGCDPCLAPQKGDAPAPDLPPCPLTRPEVEALCPWEGPYTSSPPNQWVLYGDEYSVRCNVTDALGAAASATFIPPPAAPDFTLTCSPTSLTTPPGGATATTCTVTSLYGFTSSVTLSCANLPSGVTCTPSPNPITPPSGGTAASTVTFTAAAGTALGSYSVQVSGTGGGLTRSASLTLNVSNPALSASISVANWLATCTASGGTPPYTYRWYVRYICDPCLAPTKGDAPSPDLPPCPLTRPDVELVCPWEGPYTSSPPNQWSLYGDESGVRCNVTDAVGGVVNVYYYP